MNHLERFAVSLLVVSTLGGSGCQSSESELEQQAAACESRCGSVQSECSSDPAFADPWQLSCEVACNLDFIDEARPLEACLQDAQSCGDKDACVQGGPSGWTTAASAETGSTSADGSSSSSTTTGPEDDDDATGSSDATGDGTSGGVVEGEPCCDVSGAACLDPEILECTCEHMPGCCEGVWGEVCASVAVANDCIHEGCSTLQGWNMWNCVCSATDVYCPDDPFVSQIDFPTDACGVSETDALAIAEEACEQGDGTYEIGAGSCQCECSDLGVECAPPQ